MGLVSMESNLSDINEDYGGGGGVSPPTQTYPPSKGINPAYPDEKTPTTFFDNRPVIKPKFVTGFFDTSVKEKDPVGVNYFLDINATGFTTFRKYSSTDYILNETGGPIIPQPLYLDLKGDFNPKYSPSNKSEPVFRVSSDIGSPMQNISIVGIRGLHNYSALPNRMGYSFIPPFNDTTAYTYFLQNHKEEYLKLRNHGENYHA